MTERFGGGGRGSEEKKKLDEEMKVSRYEETKKLSGNRKGRDDMIKRK